MKKKASQFDIILKENINNCFRTLNFDDSESGKLLNDIKEVKVRYEKRQPKNKKQKKGNVKTINGNETKVKPRKKKDVRKNLIKNSRELLQVTSSITKTSNIANIQKNKRTLPKDIST